MTHACFAPPPSPSITRMTVSPGRQLRNWCRAAPPVGACRVCCEGFTTTAQSRQGCRKATQAGSLTITPTWPAQVVTGTTRRTRKNDVARRLALLADACQVGSPVSLMHKSDPARNLKRSPTGVTYSDCSRAGPMLAEPWLRTGIRLTMCSERSIYCTTQTGQNRDANTASVGRAIPKFVMGNTVRGGALARPRRQWPRA